MNITRKEFLTRSSALAAASILTPLAVHANTFGYADKKIKIGVIGCGSVSGQYLPHLSKSPFVELVSTCDIRPERAKTAAEKYKIPNHYPHIDQMLAGPKFDLMVTLTDMQMQEVHLFLATTSPPDTGRSIAKIFFYQLPLIPGPLA